jgi:hypothetical protein
LLSSTKLKRSRPDLPPREPVRLSGTTSIARAPVSTTMVVGGDCYTKPPAWAEEGDEVDGPRVCRRYRVGVRCMSTFSLLGRDAAPRFAAI